MNDVLAGVPIQLDYAASVDRFENGAGLLNLVAFIATAVAFCWWFYRAHGNLRAFGAESLRYTPMRAVLGFFEPGLNLEVPRRVMSEVWEETVLAARSTPLFRPTETPRDLVGAWWTLFLIALFAQGGAAYVMNRSETPEQLQWAVKALLATDAIELVAAIVAALLVRSVTNLQASVLTNAEANPLVSRLVSIDAPQ